jgi:hypothetical protein
MGRLITVGIAVGILVLSGCYAQPEPVVEEEPPPLPVPIEEQPVEVIPEFIDGGSAEDNLPYIDYVLTEAGAGTGLFGSLDAVAVLENAGFDRASMEVTSDRTALEFAAESITIAVIIDGECALGQWSSEWYASTVTPLLGTGTCLLGDTLSLD